MSCSVEACDRAVFSRGYCHRHYRSEHYVKAKPLYTTWEGMRARCNNRNHKAYADYGGRGITVCKRWESYDKFAADMGERPAGASLDRIDNDKGYSPANCRWATTVEQRHNQRPRSHANPLKNLRQLASGRWQARATDGTSLGTFETLELATKKLALFYERATMSNSKDKS